MDRPKQHQHNQVAVAAGDRQLHLCSRNGIGARDNPLLDRPQQVQHPIVVVQPQSPRRRLVHMDAHGGRRRQLHVAHPRAYADRRQALHLPSAGARKRGSPLQRHRLASPRQDNPDRADQQQAKLRRDGTRTQRRVPIPPPRRQPIRQRRACHDEPGPPRSRRSGRARPRRVHLRRSSIPVLDQERR